MPDMTNNMAPWVTVACEGCGGLHGGGGNAEIECLRVHLRAARAALQGAVADSQRNDFLDGLDDKGRRALAAAGIETLADLRQKVRELPMSAHEKQQMGYRRGE